MPNYCQVNFCSYEVGIIDTSHCIFHRFKCIDKNCSQRLYNWTYCAEHKHKFYEKCKEVNIHLFLKNIMEENSTWPRCICHFENYQDLVMIMYGRIIDNEKNQLKSLVKQRTDILGTIEEVTRFSTWWSKENIATIITINDNSFWVFLGIIDRKPNSYGKVLNSEIFIFPTSPCETKWGIYSREKHDSLRSAEIEAIRLRDRLNGNNPILVLHPQANSYTSFTNIVCKPYVKDDWNVSTNDFKPLDIAWIKRSSLGNDYYHVGIYLGDGELCHIAGGGFFSPDFRGVRRCGWSEFLRDNESNILHRYHPIIPFKHYIDVVNQIGWAMFNHFRDGQYCLSSRNCEHFANVIIYGINYSKQVDEKRTRCEAFCPYVHNDCNANNNKGSTICLRNEIKETNNLLEKKSDYLAMKIEERYEVQIEVPIKTSDCIIM